MSLDVALHQYRFLVPGLHRSLSKSGRGELSKLGRASGSQAVTLTAQHQPKARGLTGLGLQGLGLSGYSDCGVSGFRAA